MPVPSVWVFELGLVVSARYPMRHNLPTYAIGLFLDHLLAEGSPKALIVSSDPSNSSARGSALILSTARLKCLVLLSEEKTSV